MKISKKTYKKLSNSLLLPFLIICLISSVFFWKVFLKNQVPLPADFVVGVYFPWLDYKWGFPAGVPVKNPITTDVVSFTYPMQTYAISQLKQGIIPLWNPLILTGIPLMANFQSAPFAVTNIFYLFLSTNTAWTARIISQHILAAFFTYLLLRHWKLSKLSSILGGILFAFSGFNIIWSQWNAHTLSASFIPLLLLLQEKYLNTKKTIFGILFSIALAAQILSGYPQLEIYTAIALGISLLIWVKNNGLTRNSAILTKLVLFAALGFSLIAFQLLPAKELLDLSQREVEPHPFEWAFLPFSKVITFIAPDYFGNHATKNYWGPTDYTTTTGFVGVVGLSLATVGLFSKTKHRFYSATLALTGLFLSFPTPISILIWKTGLLGLQAASAHRALIIWNLGIALLAALGAENILNNKNIKIRKTLIVQYVLLLSFVTFAAYHLIIYKSNPEILVVRGIPKYTVALRNSVFPGLILILTTIALAFYKLFRTRKFIILLLFLLLIAENFRFGWKFTPFSPRNIIYPTTPALEFLISQEKPFRTTGSRVVPINMRMPYGIETLEGYDAVYPLNISKLLAANNGGQSGTKPLGRYGTVDNDTSKILDLANVEYNIALLRDQKKDPDEKGELSYRFPEKKYEVVFTDRTTVVLKNSEAISRAHIFFDWVVEKNQDKQLDYLLDKNSDIKKTAILDKNPNINKNTAENTWSTDYKIYQPNYSLINTISSSEGLLFVSELYYPGWRAYVNGVEVPILKTNYAFRGVEIPKGQSTVEFKYLPHSFYNGLKISLFSAIILVSLLIQAIYVEKRN